MPSLNVNVLLDAASRDDIDRIAKKAKAAGLALGDAGILSAIGALQGSIDEKALHRLRKIPGIQSVEIDRTVGVLDTPSEGS